MMLLGLACLILVAAIVLAIRWVRWRRVRAMALELQSKFDALPVAERVEQRTQWLFLISRSMGRPITRDEARERVLAYDRDHA
jgi:hypothetical protein